MRWRNVPPQQQAAAARAQLRARRGEAAEVQRMMRLGRQRDREAASIRNSRIEACSCGYPIARGKCTNPKGHR